MPVRATSNINLNTVEKRKGPFQESVYNWASKDSRQHHETGATSSTYGSLASISAKSKTNVSKSKTDRYVSIHHEQSRQEYKASQVSKAATFGPLKVHVEPPTEFLKSHPARVNTKAAGNAAKKAANDRKRALLWEPRYEPAVPVTVPVYPKKGEKRATELDCYKEKKDYGKVPVYIGDRKQELKQKKETEEYLQAAQKAIPADGLVQLPEKERLEILDGLQKAWERLMVDFQKLPLVVDTVPKINRKVSMENQLKQVELDIEKFSNKRILVHTSQLS